MMHQAGITEAETIFCIVSLELFKSVFWFSISVNQGKIKRIKPFYVDEFKFLRNLVAPEVGWFFY